MMIIKCSSCGKEMQMMEDMEQFICPYCKTIHSKQPSIIQMPITNEVLQQQVLIENTNMEIREEELENQIFEELGDGHFQYAGHLCEQLITYNYTNAKAYLGQLMVELKIRQIKELADCEVFSEKLNYKRCIRFADEDLKKELQRYLTDAQKIASEKKKKLVKKIVQLAVGIVAMVVLIVFYQYRIKPEIKLSKNLNKFEKAEIGTTVKYGAYEQNNDKKDGKEKIEWVVADKKDEKVLLVSKYYLDVIEYKIDKGEEEYVYPVLSWEGSKLQKWLNNDFLKSAFTNDEKRHIELTEFGSYRYGEKVTNEDYIFVLAPDEMSNDIVLSDVSKHAKSQENEITKNRCNLSQQILYGFDMDCFPSYCFLGESHKFCSENSSIYEEFKKTNPWYGMWYACKVRPAIWVDCDMVLF